MKTVMKMQIKNLSNLLYIDFDIRNITVSDSSFEKGHQVYYTLPRKKNILHFVKEGSRFYDFDGKHLEMKAGDMIFIPDKMTYFSSSYEDTCGIGTCFDLVDTNGEPIEIARGVYREWNCEPSKLNDYVERLWDAYNGSAEILSVKLYLMRLIHLLARGFTYSSKDYNMIKPALEYIKKHFTENTYISVYAEECHMSESYFRKKFSEVLGMSPVEYRNELRFSEAKNLYRSGLTLQEISDRLGFYDVSYFSRIYKKAMGDSLKNTFDIV